VTAFVAALRKPMTVLRINATALAIDLALVAALIPSIGAAAAVVANCVGQLVSMALSIRLVRADLGFEVPAFFAAVRPFAFVAAASTGATALGLVLISNDYPVWAAILVSLAASCSLSLATARLSGGLVTERDMRAVDTALPRLARAARATLDRLGLFTGDQDEPAELESSGLEPEASGTSASEETKLE
jgi:hypothetical protein